MKTSTHSSPAADAIRLLLPMLCLAMAPASAASAGAAGALPVRFAHPAVIRYDHQAFTIHGRDVYLFSGCFHYFRCAPALWDDRLEKIHAAGFNTVETYVPWNWHEPQQGHVDLSQLDRFLSACQRHHLWVIVRPGPYVCAEWDEGGWPHWLAIQRPGFRTDSPADVRWSRYWYDEALPVIRRRLITHGGSVILMQIENEYSYSGLPGPEEAGYVKSLYADAKRDGIDVPLITCWTRVARDKADPVMSQILDASNFYPGWGIGGTRRAIDDMERQEPFSPPMVTELQGGWFSDVGQASTRHVNSYGPGQVNALTKFVMAHGVAASSYYMLYGGTNFGYWGSRGRTTSYDYTAPIAEPGGLWAKYRAVKLIGDFVRIAGPVFVRATAVPDGASTATPGVEALLRRKGGQGILFVRNDADSAVIAPVTVTGPGGQARTLRVALGPRDARLLPIGLSAGGATVNWSTVELAEATRAGASPLLVAYGNPGERAALQVDGHRVAGLVTGQDQLLKAGHAVVALTSRARAGRTRTFPWGSGTATVVSDSYLITRSAAPGNGGLRLSVQALPGTDRFTLLTGAPVRHVQIDGRAVHITQATVNGVRAARFAVAVPSLPFRAVPIRQARVRADRQAPSAGWRPVAATADGQYPSLDGLGYFDNGYSLYRGALSLPAAGKLQAWFYDADWHCVAIDGKAIPALTGSQTSQEADLSALKLAPGRHQVEVLYENEGRPNGGNMEQIKGLRALGLAPATASDAELDHWKLSPDGTPGRRPKEARADFDDSSATAVAVGHDWQDYFDTHRAGWLRTRLQLSARQLAQPGLRLDFAGVDDNATVFVNGRFAARHEGWDEPFSVPLARVAHAGDNVIAVRVENTSGRGGIFRPVTVASGVASSVPLKLFTGLPGRHDGWQKPDFDAGAWKLAPVDAPALDPNGVTWYRAAFRLPNTHGWDVPWGLDIHATGNAQLWINGHLAGRFFARGPQTRFYLPSCWLRTGAATNSLALVLRPAGNGSTAPAIRSLQVAPYTEYAPRVMALDIR